MQLITRILRLGAAIIAGIVLITVAVINRQAVPLRLDPTSADNPVIGPLNWPFFWYLMAAVLAGMLVGWTAAWFAQGKWRKTARQRTREAYKWKQEADRLTRERGQDTHPALSAPTG